MGSVVGGRCGHEGALLPPPLFSHNAFILQNAMSAVEDISHPIPLTTEQMRVQVEALESALHVGRAERDAFGLADRARSKTGLAYVALSAECLALQQEVAKLQAEGAVLARGPRASPAVPLPVPHHPGTSSVMRPVDEFLMRTMLDITSVLKSAAEKSAAVKLDTTSSPYEKRVKLLDKILSVWGYIPFADFDVESLKVLQTRLPHRKNKTLKLVGGELRVDEDDDVADFESQHMDHWEQGCQFVLSRMVVHPDKRVSSPEVLQDRIMFFQVIDGLKISDGNLKLTTINEFLRRMAVIKAELWMPEFDKNQLLFTEALLLESGFCSGTKRKAQDRASRGADKMQCIINSDAESFEADADEAADLESESCHSDPDFDADACQPEDSNADDGEGDDNAFDIVADGSSPAQVMFEGA